MGGYLSAIIKRNGLLNLLSNLVVNPLTYGRFRLLTDIDLGPITHQTDNTKRWNVYRHPFTKITSAIGFQTKGIYSKG